ncbi:papain family cysteine protease, partial [Opisthorchis viverrini]
LDEFENEYELYENFKAEYKKNYEGREDGKRFKIFKDNLLKAKMYQRLERGTATYGVTQFFDLTEEEFRRLYLTYKSPNGHKPISRIHVQKVGQLPSYFDWREYGAVGPVMNQGQCGSCWAFSAVQNIEGQWFMKIHRLLSLSVQARPIYQQILQLLAGTLLCILLQEVVDCDHADHGCSGGFPIHAFECVQRLGGLELAVQYPYVGYRQYCQADPRYFIAYINGSVVLPKDSEQIANFLARFGPLSVVLDARLLQYYQSGILNPSAEYCDPEELNHAVLSVGFGTDQGIPYWIIKNSWGEQWGEQEFFAYSAHKPILWA